MNPFVRWWRFNLVGAMGMVLQLTAVFVFSRWAGPHYLVASAAAIELTLLHNFVWHIHYTWRDRSDSSMVLTRLIQFHLSNGLTSIVGNLLLMRLLVGRAHVPLIASNGIAIICCSTLNFCMGHWWAFAAKPRATLRQPG